DRNVTGVQTCALPIYLDSGYGFKVETAPIHPSLQALAAPWESAAGHRNRMAKLPRTALVGILLRDRFGGRVRVDREGSAVVDYRSEERRVGKESPTGR